MKMEFLSVKQEKEACCGCAACVDVCPVHAIEMAEDSEGFLYPKIDSERCIGCDRCVQVCGFYRGQKRDEPVKAYALKHKNPTIRENSRSGAAFVGFSDFVLKQGGVVYGAVLQKDFSVAHCRAQNADERQTMTKVKYVQSNTVHVFLQVEQDLCDRRLVMFSGTPCQVHGLQTFLQMRKVDADRLICCDIVCHGVPSPAVWRNYLNMIETRFDKKIVSVEFRDKQFGWDSHFESFVLEGKSRKVVCQEYADLFGQAITLRPCCHNCPFASTERCSDLTLADCWGIEKFAPEFHDNRGVSLVLVNTQKGACTFQKTIDRFDSLACSLDQVLQPRLCSPSTASARREQFWRDRSSMPFDKLLKKYTTPSDLAGTVKKAVKKVLYQVGVRNHP